mmetsp:Transcript_15837/g.43814  ORF Transcript_15837/g.43814 Transcript_15837/m.43814 type:complete len:328 (-) Transcript_15837:23-1006(-)
MLVAVVFCRNRFAVFNKDGFDIGQNRNHVFSGRVAPVPPQVVRGKRSRKMAAVLQQPNILELEGFLACFVFVRLGSGISSGGRRLRFSHFQFVIVQQVSGILQSASGGPKRLHGAGGIIIREVVLREAQGYVDQLEVHSEQLQNHGGRDARNHPFSFLFFVALWCNLVHAALPLALPAARSLPCRLLLFPFRFSVGTPLFQIFFEQGRQGVDALHEMVLCLVQFVDRNRCVGLLVSIVGIVGVAGIGLRRNGSWQILRGQGLFHRTGRQDRRGRICSGNSCSSDSSNNRCGLGRGGYGDHRRGRRRGKLGRLGGSDRRCRCRRRRHR